MLFPDNVKKAIAPFLKDKAQPHKPKVPNQSLIQFPHRNHVRNTKPPMLDV